MTLQTSTITLDQIRAQYGKNVKQLRHNATRAAESKRGFQGRPFEYWDEKATLFAFLSTASDFEVRQHLNQSLDTIKHRIDALKLEVR